ncbi:hypothetical protein [Yinghuangia sp. YIM S10712]|uniref:hypothetical protein n=1 Tax=Yinghuangia sp. YIM S10712 TaxID=3436930 RepID=UPI003F53C9D7
MPRRLRYYGTFDFPWPLPVCAAALGITETVRIGEHELYLSFPIAGSEALTFPPKDGIPAKLDPPGNYRIPVRHRPEKEWGRRTGRDFYYISTVAFSVLLPSHKESGFPPGIYELREGFFGWFQIVQDWAAAWSAQQLGVKTSENGSALTLYANGKLWSHGGRLTVRMPSRAMTERQVRGALQRASRGEHLPIEHRMLLSARSAYEAGDYRKSVIDAATGVEVALASYISDHLGSRQTPRDFIDKMIVDVNGLSSLFSLCVRLGWKTEISQKRLNNELTNVRNKAAHAGYTPKQDEAQMVRKHAHAIVGSLSLLPDC